MASSALRRSLPRRGSLRGALFSNPPPSVSAAAGGASHRSFQSGGGETAEEFENRLFGNSGSTDGSLFQKLDRVGNAGRRYGMGSGMGAFGGFGNRSMGGFDSLNDGMSGMLGDAARNFQSDDEEEDDWDEFEFRPDVQYRRGSMYNVRDLDLTRPAVAKNPPRPQFETTTKEVLRKADFRDTAFPPACCTGSGGGWHSKARRHLCPQLETELGSFNVVWEHLANVRFLSNFITEAGIIIKRSQTRISAKAQRKVAREIKTARAFGLMPFTTMGRRPFIFGRSAEVHHSEEEYGYEFVEKEGEPDEDNEEAEPAVDPA
ncbi:hypothetical protein PR202_gb07102 [Eleusine coracana subsp. coracana]|uniref:Small ribosomal subunit protein bS18c n=1 Tax=Eleusine coracana subsp. coracana TaxID=191504 RepID=A0AAV5EBT0_ELECO|nr:hypothetical protein PR202_gb07102 [Eleusine coracana subsp. coracana]